jgi:hypothetical protein
MVSIVAPANNACGACSSKALDEAAIAHACIVADYQSTYDSLDDVPHRVLLEEAKLSPNKHHTEDMKRRAAETGIELRKYGDLEQRINENTVVRDKEPTTTWLNREIWEILI